MTTIFNLPKIASHSLKSSRTCTYIMCLDSTVPSGWGEGKLFDCFSPPPLIHPSHSRQMLRNPCIDMLLHTISLSKLSMQHPDWQCRELFFFLEILLSADVLPSSASQDRKCLKVKKSANALGIVHCYKNVVILFLSHLKMTSRLDLKSNNFMIIFHMIPIHFV